MRKLASIRLIKSLSPIEGADFIELAHLDGWQCVVKKGEFRAGDLGVYFEIDSFLPVEPRFEFLRKNSFKQYHGHEGFRLRTVRLKGKISQGLVLPLSQFPEIQNPEIGQDVGDLLKIQLYEPPVHAGLAGDIRGQFPGFIRRTDQERIQNLYDEYSVQYHGLEFEATVKLDGASCTVYRYDQDSGVCSRNLSLKETDTNLYWRMEKKYGLIEALTQLNRNLAIQAEMIGPGIQRNNEKLTEVELWVFDVWDIDQQAYLTPEDRTKTLQELNQYTKQELWSVPVLGIFKPFAWFSTLDEILDYATGSSLNPEIQREGLVFRSTHAVGTKIISFKVVSNQYLLAE